MMPTWRLRHDESFSPNRNALAVVVGCAPKGEGTEPDSPGGKDSEAKGLGRHGAGIKGDGRWEASQTGQVAGGGHEDGEHGEQDAEPAYGDDDCGHKPTDERTDPSCS